MDKCSGQDEAQNCTDDIVTIKEPYFKKTVISFLERSRQHSRSGVTTNNSEVSRCYIGEGIFVMEIDDRQ